MKNLVRFSVLALSFLMVLPANAAQFEKNLAFGSRTPDVSKLQEFLTDQGFYSGPITGNFFSLTLKAVKAFQVKAQVPSTGFFGSLSRGKANAILDAELADSENDPEAIGATPEVPSTTADVVSKLGEQTKVLQDQLATQQAQNNLLQQQIAAQQAAQQQLQTTLNTVASNTTPVAPTPAPASQVSQPAPVLPPQPTPYIFKLGSSNVSPTEWGFRLTNLTPDKTSATFTINGQVFTSTAESNYIDFKVTGLTPETIYPFSIVMTGQEFGTFQNQVTTGSGIFCVTNQGHYESPFKCLNIFSQPVIVKNIYLTIPAGYVDGMSQLTVSIAGVTTTPTTVNWNILTFATNITIQPLSVTGDNPTEIVKWSSPSNHFVGMESVYADIYLGDKKVY